MSAGKTPENRMEKKLRKAAERRDRKDLLNSQDNNRRPFADLKLLLKLLQLPKSLPIQTELLQDLVE